MARFPAGGITLDDIAASINARLAGQEMRVKVVVEDQYGNEIIVQPYPRVVRWGESVQLDIKLALEVT